MRFRSSPTRWSPAARSTVSAGVARSPWISRLRSRSPRAPFDAGLLGSAELALAVHVEVDRSASVDAGRARGRATRRSAGNTAWASRAVLPADEGCRELSASSPDSRATRGRAGHCQGPRPAWCRDRAAGPRVPAGQQSSASLTLRVLDKTSACALGAASAAPGNTTEGIPVVMRSIRLVVVPRHASGGLEAVRRHVRARPTPSLHGVPRSCGSRRAGRPPRGSTR